MNRRERLTAGAGLVVLTAAAVAIRLLFIAPYPTGWDDVDFALALEQYDLSRMQPHFPGYPVYILAAHLFWLWLQDPFLALSVLSAAAGGLTVIPLWLLFHKMGSPAMARITVWLYALAPLPLVTGIQPMSESLGVFLAAWLAYFSWSAGGDGGTARVGRKPGSGAARWLTSPAAWRLLAAGITLGLLLGVRVSYWALSALWLWAVVRVIRASGLPLTRRLGLAAVSAGAAAGICAVWLSALVVSTGGADSFLAVAVSFTGGHFSDWGGAYHAGSTFLDRALLDRAGLFFFRQIGAAGLGAVWPEGGRFAGFPEVLLKTEVWRWISTVLIAAGAMGLAAASAIRLFAAGGRRGVTGGFGHRLPAGKAGFLLIWIVPYLLWAFFAQNVEKPRHILPLLPPLLYLLATGLWRLAGWAASRRSVLQRRIFTVLGVVWGIAMTGVSYPLLKEAHATESPMMQLARYVKENVPTENSLIFTWEEQRVLRYVSPAHTAIRLRKWEDFRREILQYPEPPARILATSATVEGMDRPVKQLFREVAVFQGSPWLYPTYHTITLYEGTPALHEELRKGKGETAWKSKRF